MPANPPAQAPTQPPTSPSPATQVNAQSTAPGITPGNTPGPQPAAAVSSTPQGNVQPNAQAAEVRSEQRSEPQPVRAPKAKAPQPPAAPSPLAQNIQKVTARFYLAFRNFGLAVRLTAAKIGKGLVTLLRRILPDETMLDFSPSTLLFLALVIPLLIGVTGAMVWYERGQRIQYEALYAKAVEQAAAAQAKTEASEQHAAWKQVLTTVEQAEAYVTTPESQNLRTQASSKLDLMDGVTRLDFQPALVRGLNRSVNVTRLASFENDLYILDGTEGRVLRAIFTGGSYELDEAFDCGPSASPIFVGPLIDMAAFPRQTEAYAEIIAMDSNGSVLQCIPGHTPLIQQLTPANTSFGTPRAFDLNDNNIYVLDPTSNAVWIYRDLQFGSPPHFFFGDQIPPMQNVIDLTVDMDRLYMLHSDGHQTRCNFGQAQCEDPYPYTDRRPGRQTGRVILDALFNQIFLAPPPEPSLYLLDPASQAVYRFGLQLSFDVQYRSREPLPEGKASAFTISKNRRLFIAIGNQVFYAPLP